MTAWRIVCIKQATVPDPTPHVHITHVGTGDRADWADMRWELHQVLEAMDEGEAFYIQSADNGPMTPVESCACPFCKEMQLRSVVAGKPGADLDNMRPCIFS